MIVRPELRILGDREIKMIHEASLRLLETNGVCYESKTALDIL